MVSGGQLSLLWLIRLRYAAVLGELLVAVVAFYGFGFHGERSPIFLLIALALGSNLFLPLLRVQSESGIKKLIGSILVLDVILLTGLLYFSGGPGNPFSILYLVHVSLAGVILGQLWSWVTVTISSLLFGFLFLVPGPMPLHHNHGGDEMFASHLQGMWISYVIAASLIAYFQTRLVGALQKRERDIVALRELAARQEHLASLATLAAGAAHEISTPLATVSIAAEALESRLNNGEYATDVNFKEERDDAALIRSQVERCREILDRMSGRAGESELLAPEDISAAQIAKRLQGEFPADTLSRLHFSVAKGDILVRVRPTLLVQALVSLTRNAIDASPLGSPVTLQFLATELELVVRIVDQGIGIEAEILRRVGEPFFTTKEPGRGMGFGVFLARSFAERAGGSLHFSSNLNHGTAVELRLPRSDN